MSIPDQTAKFYGFTAIFSWEPATGFHVAWEPGIPFHSRRYWRKFHEAYAAARRRFMAQVAAELGGSVLILDADGCREVVPPQSH
jgi:hypothetical protein